MSTPAGEVVLQNQGPSRFYGATGQIKRDQERFLRHFAGARVVLDLGCGDGLFLELLRDRCIEGHGVDLSAGAVAACRRKGFSQVVCRDVLDFLRESATVYDGIFCAHLIEHLAPAAAIDFLDLCSKRLAPEGRLVIVTPNPVSLQVSAEYFWLDPTHVRPYPLPLLAAMLADAGLDVVEQGHYQGSGLPRRDIPRRVLLRLLLGRYFGPANSYAVAVKPRSG